MTDLENKILYVDMDGVSAKWEDATYQDVSSEGFFLSRKSELNLIEAVRLIFESGVDTHILSSVLDNYTRNLVHWKGIGIKYCTDCNDSHGSWDGHRIHATDTASEIAEKILMIMKMD